MQTLPPQRLAAAILLAMIAGCVDAVGFTQLSGHFVSFMSGNSTRLGLHIADREWPSALFTFGLVTLFVGGAAAGALIIERAGRAAATVVLLCEAALLAGAAYLLNGWRPLLGAVLLPPAMGLANSFLPSAGHAPVGVTYMTGALVRIGTGLAAFGREPGRLRGVLLDLLLWLALVAGVALGEFGRLRFGGYVLLFPAAALTILGLAEAVFVLRRRG
jgi:uncharacterized membrane protein YoaK (UPF0700 family)